MKLLRKIPSKGVEESFFNMCIKSKSGCNVTVEGKNYNIYVDARGEYVINEFKLDYELTKKEFDGFLKK